MPRDEALALFDRWVDATPSQRDVLLASLEATQPEVHARLLALLHADAAAQAAGFLETTTDGVAMLGPTLAATDTPTPPATRAHAGLRLGAWCLEAPIGAGGMGEVWRARRVDGLYEGRAAVKLLQAARSGAHDAARFAREGELLARLEHPHIARLLDAGLAPDGGRYLVLEHVQGERIDAWCDRHRLDLRARVALFIRVCDAVAFAHGRLVVHRDLKPANLLVTEDGEPKLLDFGVAKLIDAEAGPAADTALTRDAAAGLTPDHAAPEQLDGGPVTTATDVYALGVMLFGLLSGARPYAPTAGSIARLVKAVVEDPPRRLHDAARALGANPLRAEAVARRTTPAALLRALGGDLEAIVGKALRKAPGDRYPTVAALRDDLQRHLDHEPVAARPAGWGYRGARFVQRHPVPVAAAAAALAAMLIGAGVAAWQWRVAVQEGRRTQAVVEVLTRLFAQVQPEQAGRAQVSVRELLQRGWNELERGLEGDPDLRAEVAWSLGTMLNAAGDVPGAQRAFELRRAQLVAAGRTESIDHLRVLLELGFCAQQQADHPTARARYAELLGLAARMGASDGEEAMLARLRLATLARTEGRLAEAEQGLRAVEAQSRQRWGEAHAVRVLALEELAELLRQRGQWDEAMARYAALTQLTAGARGALAARARLAQATLLVESGRFAEAARALPTAVSLAAEVWGDGEVTHTAVARLWLAQALFRSGQGEAADRLAAQALAATRAADHTYGRLAVEVLQLRHDLRRDRLGLVSRRLPAVVAELDAGGEAMKPLAERARALQGELLLRQGAFAAARGVLDRTLAAQRQLYEEGDTDLWPTLALRGLAQAAQGRGAAAQADLDGAAEIADRLLPPGHPDRHVARSLARLARVGPPDASSAAAGALAELAALERALPGHQALGPLSPVRAALQRPASGGTPFLSDSWRLALQLLAL